MGRLALSIVDKTGESASQGVSSQGTEGVNAQTTGEYQTGLVFAGKYRIVQKLGSGGMGAVYQAEHTLMGRTVALKLLHSHLSTNENYLMRFQREARIASKLTHPNAITLYDFGIEQETPFLVLEFVQGRTLKEILSEEGALPLDRIASILRQISGALQDAHTLGIVHRDLKPDNIMITKTRTGEEMVRVLDFGIAKLVGPIGQDAGVLATQAGVFVGTPAYMSPEQASEKEVDSRSDIYALGIIIYEMLTGVVPFTSDSPVELLFKHLHTPPKPIREIRQAPGVSQDLNAVVMKALEKDPNQRYQRVAELVSAFEQAVNKSVSIRPVDRKPINIGISVLLVISLALLVITYFLTIPQKAKPKKMPVVASDPNQPSTSPLLTKSEEAMPKEVATETPELTKPTLKNEPTAPSNDLPPPPILIPSLVSPPTEATVEAKVEAPVNATDTPLTLPLEESPLKETAHPTEIISELAAITEPLGEQEIPEQQGEVAASDEIVTEQSTQEVPPSEAVVEDTLQPLNKLVNENASPVLEVGDPLLAELLSTPEEIKGTNPQVAQREAERLYQHGQERLKEKDYLNAGLAFRQAIAHRGNSLLPRISLGYCLIKLNHSERAFEELTKALNLDQNYAPTYYNLATYYVSIEDPDQAVTALARAISLFPQMKEWAKTDADFDKIREHPVFLELIPR